MTALAAATLASPATAASASSTRTAKATRKAAAARAALDTRRSDGARLDKLPLVEPDGTRVTVSTAGSSASAAARSRSAKASAVAEVPVGTNRSWLALDDVKGVYYRKNFELMAVGDHIEVWVAKGTQPAEDPSTDTQFLPGDCRNDRTQVTTAQAEYLADQFDNRMYPKESAAFSVPPSRDGSTALVSGDFTGPGDKIVTLVDNVRDDQFYDFNNSQGNTYIAGFFSSALNAYTGRNVMTIDAYDWLHRTGANPPNDPVPGNLCTSAPARPYLYEGTFAHEYQHLLESYVDGDETSWVNEGLSDFAQTLVGYVDATRPITQTGFDNHVQCFLGAYRIQTPANPTPRDQCGPENSLTNWQDQGAQEILADYGAAYTFMLFLYDRYGTSFMSALHKDPLNGLASITDTLKKFHKGADATDVLHQWAVMVALDKALSGSSSAYGSLKRRYTTPSLDAAVSWESPYAYNTPGAPANGSDYVRLRDASGAWLPASAVKDITFSGARMLEAVPVQWTVDTAAEGHEGDAALYSGHDDSQDRAIIRSVDVPADNATLSFDTRWSMEDGYDFAVVQVSTDGGKTFTSLSNADTTSEQTDTTPVIQANLPGFNGDSGGWRSESFDLSAYAGKSVLLSFRYLTDSGTNYAGWWVDNVKVGGTLVSDGSSLAGWQTPTQISPVPVHGFTVQVVGYSSTGDKVDVVAMKLKNGFTGTLRGGKIRALFGRTVDTIAAIVTYDEPTETVTQQARYSLTVNGVLQPGG
ncbi:choice-of-anchor J domain-containing protein [Motilibacter peucedani]|uniref:choice-of-anchor J domain-containing protein n=1 Tax=Motilibacter peucedani TaxID=598650 RepID=UPI001604243C|nr:choice-of-anchor J domain-containing protein [Motilibacter peucedani]